MQAFICLGFAALLSGAAVSQSVENPAVEKPTRFEAADVHGSAPVRYPFRRGPRFRGGIYELRDATMVDLVAAAYGVDDDKVVGGPTWLEMDRFDVIARGAADATPDKQKIMLQGLLAERFKLVVHSDTRPMTAYGLTVGKRALLKEADGSGDTGCKFVPPNLPPQTGGGLPAVPTLGYTCRNMTMAAFAEGMRRMVMAEQVLNGNSVIDQTGLKGSWDFDFKYTPTRIPIPMGAGATISLIDAIDKQLGLKLEPVKIPLPVMVVDRVNQKPTENLAGVVESLHVEQAPTEFEVADVKPSGPETRGMRFQIQPGGRVNISGVTLKFLIEQAWNITDDMLIGAPKWLGDDRFDIIAKASTTPGSPGADFDTVWVMLKALVIERFKLVTHSEERAVSSYNLVAVKPKMKKADPASRTRYKEGPAAADGKDPRDKNPMLTRLVTVQNMTMAQFAEKLQTIAPGYIHTPVLDATGLEGSWDFTLNFSPAGMEQFVAKKDGGGRGGEGAGPSGVMAAGVAPGASASGQGAGQAGAVEASDPSGAVTLFEAIEKQLGLKLEKQKRQIGVLVIDHVEQKPTDN